jgi:HK97 family phage portal protein
MEATAILGPDGRPFQANLEDPNLDLHDPATWEGVLTGVTTQAGVKVSARTAIAYPPLWRAINLIAGDVGRLPLVTYERLDDDGKEKAKKHPAYPLVRRRPNPVLRASTLKRTMTAHALLHGNGYAAIFRDGAGRPAELFLLDPEETCVGVYEGRLRYVTWLADGREPLPLAPEDVLHIRGLSQNGLVGISVVELFAEAIGLPLAARQFMSRFFGQGSNQSGILLIPSTFTDEKIKTTLKLWNETAAGIAKSHKVGLLKDNVKWVPTTVKPKEAETTPILEHEVRSVSAITGCPPHKLGDVSRTSHNSLEQENQSYLDDCLDVWLNEWEEECDLKLLTPEEQIEETHFHEFNRNARLRMDASARSAFYKSLREGGVLSANDVCRRENMPTIGPAGDKRFRPANWVPLESDGDSATQARDRRATRAHRKLIADVLDKRLQIEREKVTKAAAKESDFAAWSVKFYQEHLAHLTETLAAIRGVVEAHAGRRLNRTWATLIRRELAAHRDALVAAWAAGCSDSRAEAVAAVALAWTNESLTRNLLSPRKGKRDADLQRS